MMALEEPSTEVFTFSLPNLHDKISFGRDIVIAVLLYDDGCPYDPKRIRGREPLFELAFEQVNLSA